MPAPHRSPAALPFRSLAAALCALLAAACGMNAQDRHTGQTSFASAPPGGTASRGGTTVDAGGAGATPTSAPAASSSAPTRTVEETDIYRVDGDRLYTLNSYRGLLVFDISDPDHPRLLGRSPIVGWPVEMVVRSGIASVVVADWAGELEDGTPFHGSIVRSIDARDPTNMQLIGEAFLGGWISDTRLVGDVLYAISTDYGWYYGDADASTYNGPSLLVTSVLIPSGPGDTTVKQVQQIRRAGWDGVFNVTPDSILFASAEGDWTSTRTRLDYLDISDPAGAILERGSLVVDGRVQGWGPDNGRFNLDFADGRTARSVGCGESWCGNTAGYVVAIADFADPDHPRLRSQLAVPSRGWQPAVRFDGTRLYLSPGGYWQQGATTPLGIYDLSDSDHPVFAGSTDVPGSIWSFFPAGDRLFALGNDWQATSGRVTLSYLDVSDAQRPVLLGTAAFGDGWAWTPAAGTFKAFTRDPVQGLVVLPFSGWSYTSWKYTNGLQLIEYAPTSVRTAGAALTSGWVERGVFAKGRLFSISDLALAVVDPTDHDHPRVVTELTLARNVLSAVPAGGALAVVSGDFWEQDLSRSELRLLKIADAEEDTLPAPLASVQLEGANAQVFTNGDLLYAVTTVQRPVPCGIYVWPDAAGRCLGWTNLVTVVDLSGGGAQVRGKVELPVVALGWWPYWGWWGCFWWDWYDGEGIVQAGGGDALAFRRWLPYRTAGETSDGSREALFLVDLADPDAPKVSSTTITDDPTGWWGNLVASGNRLFATHYEWDPPTRSSSWPVVRYWLDQIDLGDRAHLRVAAKVNVPGVVIGASTADPSVVYAADFRWEDGNAVNRLDTLRLGNGVAELLGSVAVSGWVGRVIVRDQQAWFSTQRYDWVQDSGPRMGFHQLDLSDPSHPLLRDAPERQGWGWLLGVVGDRAIVTSGWGTLGVDLYRLADGQDPLFDRTVRARGWGASSVSRAGDQLYLASGYWGVQRISLAEIARR